MPMREELEILLVKVVLKPALTLAKKLGSQDFMKKSPSSAANSTPTGSKEEKTSRSDSSAGAALHESDYENEEFIQVQ